MPLFLQIIGLSISVLTSLVALTAVIVQMRSNVSQLQKQDEKMSAREDATAKEFTDLLVTIKSFMAEQTSINRSVLGLLSGLEDKVSVATRMAVEQPIINRQNSEAIISMAGKLEQVIKQSIESAAALKSIAEVIDKIEAR